jgi:hypothetical protein
MLAEPVNASRACANDSADQDSRRTADQAADQHSTGSAATSFHFVAPVMTRSFELALLIDVGARPSVGIDQSGVQNSRSPVGKIKASGKIPMVGLPVMRRGSRTLVTRPSTIVPAGINVLLFSTTG